MICAKSCSTISRKVYRFVSCVLITNSDVVCSTFYNGNRPNISITIPMESWRPLVLDVMPCWEIICSVDACDICVIRWYVTTSAICNGCWRRTLLPPDDGCIDGSCIWNWSVSPRNYYFTWGMSYFEIGWRVWFRKEVLLGYGVVGVKRWTDALVYIPNSEIIIFSGQDCNWNWKGLI